MKKSASISVLVAFVVVAATYPLEDESEYSIQPGMSDPNWPAAQYLDIPIGSANEPEATLSLHLREKREPRRKRGEASIGIERNRMGTDVNAQVQSNLWQSRNGRSNVDANANFQQHFGGPAGRQRPNYGAGVQFSHKF